MEKGGRLTGEEVRLMGVGVGVYGKVGACREGRRAGDPEKAPRSMALGRGKSPVTAVSTLQARLLQPLPAPQLLSLSGSSLLTAEHTHRVQ